MEPSETGGRHRTVAERRSDRELVVRRTFEAPPRLVFKAWTTPELLQRWWAPRSSGARLVDCQLDVRAGGAYRFVFGLPDGRSMTFFGKYVEVVTDARLVWTNEESDDGAVSTLTLEEQGGRTLLVLSELYPTKAAADRSIEGMEEGMPEQFEQLDELLPTLE